MFKQLIWADRVAVVWWGLIALLLWAVWKDPHSTPFSDPGVWHIFTLVVGIPWLLLRALDLIFTGQIRLRSMRAQMESAKAKRQRHDTPERRPFLVHPRDWPGTALTSRASSNCSPPGQPEMEVLPPRHL